MALGKGEGRAKSPLSSTSPHHFTQLYCTTLTDQSGWTSTISSFPVLLGSSNQGRKERETKQKERKKERKRKEERRALTRKAAMGIPPSTHKNTFREISV